MARLVLCVLLAGILLGVPTLAAPLEVVTISPSGKVAQARQVAIVFSEPMVPLGVVEAPEPPAILSPQPAGKWRWVDPRTLVFETPERLPQGTFYTVKVPAGVKSSSGSVLAELVAGRFETPGPTMLNPLRGERIRGLPPGGRKVITLSFDQPVDSKEVVEHVRLVGGGKEYRTSLAPDPEGGQAHAQEVHLRPLDPLAPSMEFRLVLDAGVRSKEGPLISKRQEVTFMTPPPLSFTLDRAHPRRVDIDSSNPLDEASLDSTPVTVEPPVPNLELKAYGSLVLEGHFALGQTYRVTIGQSLRDEFGQTLAQPQTLEVTIEDEPRPLDPAVWLKSYQKNPIVDPRHPFLPVSTRDLREFEVELRAVNLEQRAAWKEPRGVLPEDIGRPIERRVIKTKGLGLQTTEIDLTPALNHGVGHVLVKLRGLPEPGTGDRSHSLEATRWVQVTRIGVTAIRLKKQWAVWVASMENGQALPLAQVFSGTESPRATDGQGYVDGVKAQTDHEIFVRLGHDWTFLELRVPYPSTPEFYLVEPQGVYRPGEILPVRGFSSPGNYMRGEDLGYKIDRSNVDGSVKWGPFGAFEFAFKLPEDLTPGGNYLRLKCGYDDDAYVLPIAINNYNPSTGNVTALRGQRHHARRPGDWTPEDVLINLPSQVEPGQDLLLEMTSPFSEGEGWLWTQNDQLVRFSVRDFQGQARLRVKEQQVPTLSLEAAVAGVDLNGRCAYARGRVVANLTRADKRIRVEVQPDTSTAGQTSRLNVALRTDTGQPVSGEVTLMMVDERISRLTGHRVQNPLEIFYPPVSCPLAENWSERLVAPPEPDDSGTVFPEWAVSSTVTLSAEPSKEKSERLRDDFRTVPVFETVTVGPEGRATVPFKMPDTLTRYKITALAVASDDRYGLGESSANLGLPLALDVTAPGWLKVDDVANVPVTVRNGTGRAQDVKVHAEGTCLRVSAPPSPVKVLAYDNKVLELATVALPGESAKLRVQASAAAHQDGLELTIPLHAPDSELLPATRAGYGEVPPGGSVIQPLVAPPSGARLEIAVSSHGLFEEIDPMRQRLLSPQLARAGLQGGLDAPALIRALRLQSEVDPDEVEARLKDELDKLFRGEEGLGWQSENVKVAAAIQGLLNPRQLKTLREDLSAQRYDDPLSAKRHAATLVSIGVPLTAAQQQDRVDYILAKKASYSPIWGPRVATLQELDPWAESPYQGPFFYEPNQVWTGQKVEQRFRPAGNSGLVERLSASVSEKPVPHRIEAGDRVVANEDFPSNEWRRYETEVTSPTDLLIANGSDKPLYYRLRLRAKWPRTEANPVIVTRTFAPVNWEARDDVWREGEVWHIRKGKEVRVNLACSRPGMLTERLASGFEILSVGWQGSGVMGLQLQESGLKMDAFQGQGTYTVKALLSGEFTIPSAFLESSSPEIWGHSSLQKIVVH